MPQLQLNTNPLQSNPNDPMQKAMEALMRYQGASLRPIRSRIRERNTGTIQPRSGILEFARDRVLNTEPGRRLGRAMDFIGERVDPLSDAGPVGMAGAGAQSTRSLFGYVPPKSARARYTQRAMPDFKPNERLVTAGAQVVDSKTAGTGALLVDENGIIYRLPNDDHAAMLDAAGLAKGGEAYSPYGLSKNKLARLRVNKSSIGMQIAHEPTVQQKAAIEGILFSRDPNITITYDTVKRSGIQRSLTEALEALR